MVCPLEKDFLKLIVFHYHLRPGGIRRVIELGAPTLVHHAPGRIDELVLAAGEEAPAWFHHFTEALAPTPVRLFVEPSFNYLAEQKEPKEKLLKKLKQACRKLLEGCEHHNALVWAHNLGIARNILAGRTLIMETARRGIRLVMHHHDWWFDNRWLRWPEMRRFGIRTLDTVADSVFPPEPNVVHVSINHVDAERLQKHFPEQSGWLPNLTEPFPIPALDRIQYAQHWLQGKLGDKEAPVWILPCRLLRRKNVAEALLLTRWLRPEAWLVTTGDASSADELYYAQRLNAEARHHHWRLRLGILKGSEENKPSVPELLCVSEAVLLTSIQEGFGLPYLEASAAHRPLIARRLPNVAADLEQFGFQFPQLYDDLLIDPDLFDWKAELARQKELFRQWLNQMPLACRRWVGKPSLLAADRAEQPVPFSGLTLTAQLEVLAKPIHTSWNRCAPLNPFLLKWKQRIQSGGLDCRPWPAEAAHWLSSESYGNRFWQIASQPFPKQLKKLESRVAQEDFMRDKLEIKHLFPLLWSRET